MGHNSQGGKQDRGGQDSGGQRQGQSGHDQRGPNARNPAGPAQPVRSPEDEVNYRLGRGTPSTSDVRSDGNDDEDNERR